MKQTALQQLIERLGERFEQDKAIYENLQQQENTNLRQLEKAKGKMYSSRDAWKTACDFLEIEKQDIIEGYHEGQRNIFSMIKDIAPQHDWSKTEAEFKKVDDGAEPNEEAEQYYTQTFKQ